MKFTDYFFLPLFHVLLLSHYAESQPPTITNSPNATLYVVEGESTTLEWTYDLEGFGLVLMQFNPQGEAFIVQKIGTKRIGAAYTGRIEANVTETHSSIRFLVINKTDSKTYAFTVQNDNDATVSNVEIKVQVPPSITGFFGNQTKNESDSVNLICNATGDPEPSITLTRLPDTIVNSSFTITGKQDEGTYICTADNRVGNAATADVFIVVQNYHPINTQLSTNLTNNTVVVNEGIELTCSAQANPLAEYRFYKEQESLFNSTVAGSPSVYTTAVTERTSYVIYSCTPFNFYGDGPTRTVTVTVHCPATIAAGPSSQQVEEGNGATLFCSATCNPPPNITWTKQGSNTVLSSSETLNLTILLREDNGAVYKCKVQNSLGSDEATATITVLFPPDFITKPLPQEVVESNGVTLFCNATGNPQPNITWTKQGNNTVLSSSKTLTLTNLTKGDNRAVYKCKVQNNLGADEVTAMITVLYPPVITKPQNRIQSINASESVTIECLAEANPAALYVWKKATGEVASNDGYLRLNKVNDSDGGNYTCTATNRLDSDNVTILVKVTRREISLELTVVFLNGEEVVYRPEYDDLNSAAAKEFVGRFETEIKKKCISNSTECQVKVTKLRKGSVIVSFTLIFTTPVTTNEGLAELIDAVNNGTIGPYSVRALKVIQQVEPTTTPSASPTGTTTTEKKTTPSSDGPPWVVIGAVIGGVVVFAIIVVVVTWCLHKKRKCRRKDAKIHHSESEEQQAFSRQEGKFGAANNAYLQANHGYAGTGPRSNGTETVALQQRAAADESDAAAHRQEAATSPTYAEVDKSKKKKKKEEEKLDYTYAEVDRSKKTKKKPKSGEMIYADLEDVNVPRAMPTVSTSPQPLPPIKRPEPYENTQYADVTQFLKGDATLPQSDSNQGT